MNEDGSLSDETSARIQSRASLKINNYFSPIFCLDAIEVLGKGYKDGQVLKMFEAIKMLICMYKNTPLSTDQIEQLRIEINKILQQNMKSFSERIAANQRLTQSYNIDTLYQFSEQQYTKMSRMLENISTFTFMIMSNFEMLWQEIYHRDNKIAELRQTFSNATSYIEELKCQNEDIKNKLSEAETYIQWVEQQKQYLDAIYDAKCSTLTVPTTNTHNLNRCVSESSLRWSRPQKKSVNYEKLKDYIENLKHEKNEMQKQYVNLNKKYEIRTQEYKKANLIIEHLVERLNKNQELREYTSYRSMQKQSSRELTSDDILKILQRTQQISSTTSLENHLQMLDQEASRIEINNYFDSYSHFPDQAFREANRSDHNYSSLTTKETKEVEIGTQSQFVHNPTVETQTQNKENTTKEEVADLKISIHISGVQDKKQANIQQIIKSLDLQQQLQRKLQQQRIPQRKSEETRKSPTRKRPPSFFDYYCQKLVSNRIKKYYFKKPDQKIVSHKSILNK